MSAPRLSVIIPAWNPGAYLAEAIASVNAQLGPLAASEIVVVDDGSTDGAPEAAASLPRVTLVRQAQAGIAAARNRGLAHATGELIAFLDADDLWTPSRLAVQAPLLAAHPDAIVLGLVEEFTSPELTDAQAAELAPKPGRLEGWLAGAMLVRRATFDRVGPFDPTLPTGETVAWFARAKALGVPVHVAPELVLRRRLHAHNFTRRQAASRSDYVMLARRLLEARRRPPQER